MLPFQTILAEYRIHNADIVLKYDATADDLIDVIEGNRVYIPCIYLLNKIGKANAMSTRSSTAQQANTVTRSQ